MPPRQLDSTPGRRLGRGMRGTQDEESSEREDLDGGVRNQSADQSTGPSQSSNPHPDPRQSFEMAPPSVIPQSGTVPSPAPGQAGQPPVIGMPRSDLSRKPSSTLKAKPKIVRRSAEDRMKSEREEEERARLKSAEMAATNTSKGNLPGRGGHTARDLMRGRGGATPILQGRKALGLASGPFSHGSVIAPTTNKRRGKPSGPRESSNTSRGGHSALKRESALSTSGGRGRAATKTREPKNEDTVDREYLSSDEDDGNPRIDVKKINTIDDPIVVDDDEDNEEEPITNRKRSNAPRQSYPSWGLKPVTMDRKEHIERSGGIHIDSNDAEMLRKRAKERRDTGLFIRDESEEINTKSSRRKKKTQDVEFISATRKWKGVYTDSEEEDEEVGTKVKAPVSKTKVKKEPRDDQPNIPEATSDSVTIDSSPEAATRTPLPETTFTAKLKPKTLKHSARSAPRATEEELREWTRQNTDIRVVAEELQQNGIHMTPTIPNNTLDPLSPTSTQETTSSVTMVSTTETSATVEPEDKEGRLYVFQFPPLLPDLYNPLESAPAPAPVPILVPESSTAQTPIQIPDSTSTSNPTKTKPSSSKASKTSQAAFTPLDPPKSSTGHPTIKPDPDSSSSNTINNTTNSTSTPPSSYPTKNPPGFVGYLTIHRSRRIRLCWGGFDCDVSRGVEVAFAENAVVVADSSSSFPTSSLNSSNPAAAAAAGKKHSSAMDLDMDMDNNNNAPAIEGMGMRAEGGRMRSEKEGEKEEEDEEEGREAGFQKATSLGSIRGKLVVVPDWGRVLGSSPSSSLS